MTAAERNLLRSSTAWRVVDREPFDSHGRIEFSRATDREDLVLRLAKGDPGTGVNYRGPVPTMNYRVSAEARRVEGLDFFYGLTFPIAKQYASLIIGGWGGGVYGVSNLDGLSAVENETTGYQAFEQNRWYRIVLEVREKEVNVSLDDETIIQFGTAEHQYAVWPEQATMIPLGIATWDTGSEVRELKLSNLPS